MNRKEKKEIVRIIRKYTDESQWTNTSVKAVITGIIVGGMVGADLLFLGGMGTLSAVAAGVGVFDTFSTIKEHVKTETGENSIGQRYEAPPLVIDTLKRMENKLQLTFMLYSGRNATEADKDVFRGVAKEMQQEVQSLSKVFKMVAQDKFELAARSTQYGSSLITLSQALDEINGVKPPAAEKSAKETIDALKARISELEKPTQVDINIDKKKHTPKN